MDMVSTSGRPWASGGAGTLERSSPIPLCAAPFLLSCESLPHAASEILGLVKDLLGLLGLLVAAVLELLLEGCSILSGAPLVLGLFTPFAHWVERPSASLELLPDPGIIGPMLYVLVGRCQEMYSRFCVREMLSSELGE